MANTNIELTSLDFSGIKTNLTKWLKSQDTFKDYNFVGSGLSTHTDILAVNTQYNGFYLNAVANEMFLDSALHRNSVVSHVKPLNYTPKSKTAPSAVVRVTVNNVDANYLILPQNTNFMSEAIDGINYNFVTVESQTKKVENNKVVFDDVVIKQGYYNRYSFTVDKKNNPSLIFSIPDENIDTSTLEVVVQENSSNTAYSQYTLAKDYLEIKGTDEIYYLQEGIDGYYEIFFGDGILGKTLNDGNIVIVSYLSTDATSSYGANSFVMLDSVQGFSDIIVESISPATNGSEKESLDSIKFCAPRMYGTKLRATTPEEYEIVLKNNTLGYSFDAVNAWSDGGNIVYVSAKPSGDYYLTNTQKEQIVEKILKPSSIMSVTPKMVDPEYTYVKLRNKINCDSNYLKMDEESLKTLVLLSEQQYCSTTLNTFKSELNVGELIKILESLDKSITAADFDVWLEKRIYPNLRTMENYSVSFDNVLMAGQNGNTVEITPTISYYTADGVLIEDAFIQEDDSILSLKYYDEYGNLKTINKNIGSVDFEKGVVVLNNFSPYDINNNNKSLNISIMSKSRIITSEQQRILTLDITDPSSIQTEIKIK